MKLHNPNYIYRTVRILHLYAIFTLSCICFVTCINASPAVSPFIGFHQWSYSVYEFGFNSSLVHTQYDSRPKNGGAYIKSGWGYWLSAEAAISGAKFIAPKLGFWFFPGQTKPLTMGVSALCYFEKDNTDACLRPELGLQIHPGRNILADFDNPFPNLRIKIAYSYNLFLSPAKASLNLPRHQISLYVLRIKHFEISSYLK